jgi:hypothetical protein
MSKRVKVCVKTNQSEYYVWSNMKNRCLNKKSDDYKYYGGRGIYIYSQWLSFKNFYKDMGVRPSHKHQLDRIDNNGPYAPWNCRWATRKQNMRNTSRNHLITFQNKTQTMVEWSEDTGITYTTLRARIRNGWSSEDALTTPIGETIVNRRKNNINFTIEDYPDITGVTFRKSRWSWVA